MSAGATAGGVRDYTVFGGRLRSDVEFTELRPAPGEGAPDWTLETVDDAPPPAPGEPLATEVLLEGPTLRLWALPGDGFRLGYDDTGTFDVTDGGRTLRWYRPAGAPELLARADVIGRVLALALHANGYLCLHASAVTTEEGTIGFLAPKFFGKSTMAMAMTAAGATLVTDDTLAVGTTAPVRCRPGVHTIRLREGAARHLVDGEGKDRLGDRLLVNWLDDSRLTAAETPLVGLYVLTPTAAEGEGEAATRVPLPGVAAAMALVQHTKLGDVMRGPAAAALFQRSASVCATVPVYQLRVVRDLGRIDAVVASLLGWHGGAPAAG